MSSRARWRGSLPQSNCTWTCAEQWSSGTQTSKSTSLASCLTQVDSLWMVAGVKFQEQWKHRTFDTWQAFSSSYVIFPLVHFIRGLLYVFKVQTKIDHNAILMRNICLTSFYWCATLIATSWKYTSSAGRIKLKTFVSYLIGIKCVTQISQC